MSRDGVTISAQKTISKTIYVDPGEFYIKVYVTIASSDGDQFYGSYFFPHAAFLMGTTQHQGLCYDFQDQYYAVGYDCRAHLLGAQAADFPANADENFEILLQKILFDFGQSGEQIHLNLILNSAQRQPAFAQVCERLTGTEVKLAAWRAMDQKVVKKQVQLTMQLTPAVQGLWGYASTLKPQLTSAIIVDIGWRTTKIHILNHTHEQEVFRCLAMGMETYFALLIKKLAEIGCEAVDFLWLAKQIELNCQIIEIPSAQIEVDIGDLTENLLWDINKDFLVAMMDMLTTYFQNNARWIDMLIITGGGANFWGKRLSLSLLEKGFFFTDISIESGAGFKVLQEQGAGKAA